MNQSWYLDEAEIRIDLDDLATSDGKTFSQDDVQNLVAHFEWVDQRTELQGPPPPLMGMMVPHTYLVIRGPRFLLGVAQTVLSIWWMGTTPGTGLDLLVGGGWASLDGLYRIRNALKVLSEPEGEYCSYQATLEATGKSVLRSARMTALDTVWERHEEIRRVCPVKSCQFHEHGCQMLRKDFEKVLARLEKQSLVERDDDQIRAVW